MTLKDHLLGRIAHDGPMRLDAYMQACLLHPDWGYYTTQHPFGQTGDFVTAPEISQMFGELMGLALGQSWLDHGAPAPFTLAELGPGRGTLMADMLRACAKVPGFIDAAQITLVEASPVLEAEQREALAGYAVRWIPDASALPDQPLFVVANEFFDALPIRQFVRAGAAWRERQVGMTDGNLSFGLGPVLPQPVLNDRLVDTEDGALVELCSAAAPIIDAIARRIGSHGGVALIIDYGDWQSLGDTLQAVQNHTPVDVLATPGQSDLTAHVDFAALAGAASACAHSRVTPQGVFLERLGISGRAARLAQSLTGPALESHIAAHRRLTHPEEMGNLFKVMGLYQTGQTPPPGLEP
tara:strand:- start:33987 stop:35048 length:1062 start_codon:yes stop_codon:yes gene_type:complete